MASQIEPIRGKVAKILSDKEVVLNIGKNNNVQVGMSFAILFRGYDEIKDPDTGEALGSIDRPKAYVKVMSANDKLSIASTYRTRLVNVGGPANLGFRLRGDLHFPPPPKWESQVETFATHEVWEEYDHSVSTGDPVVQVIDLIDDVDIQKAVTDVDDLLF